MSTSTLNLFRQPKALDSQAHRQLRYAPNQPYHFAAQQALVPVMAGEIAQVAREYAVVFSDVAGSLPLALLGTRRGQNAYVRPSGHWVARYVPAHVRWHIARRPVARGTHIAIAAFCRAQQRHGQ